jgi:hypothetical protein
VKGCNNNEHEGRYNKNISKSITTETIFTTNRSLIKPFTSVPANKCPSRDILHLQEIGRAVLLAYVKPRYCSDHLITSEKSGMRRQKLSTFSGAKKPPKKLDV